MRTLFFGTPDIAVPALRALAATTTLVGVVCQPDRPAGRGLALSEPAVKRAARELGVVAHQPVKVKTGNLDEWIRERDVDLAVVLAYGRILPPLVLAAPRLGCVNLHASLLPRHRGAAPIQWAIMSGDPETGISLMQMDEGLDTGPVYCERRIPIAENDDAATLTEKLAALSAVVIREDLPRVVDGTLTATPQDASRATHAPPIGREHGVLVWSRGVRDLVNQVRGLSPRPGAYTTVAGRTLKVLEARSGPGDRSATTPGTVVRADKGGLWIAARDGLLEIVRGQLDGRRVASAVDLVNGRAVRLGDVLGT